MKKAIILIVLCSTVFLCNAQLALGIGPSYNLSKGNAPRYGVDISLKYYFFKKDIIKPFTPFTPIIKTTEKPIRETVRQILNDSLYGVTMQRYVEFLIKKRESELDSIKQHKKQ